MSTPHRSARLGTCTLVVLGLVAGLAGVSPTRAARPAGGVDWQPILDSSFAAGTAGVWPVGNRGAFNEQVGGGMYTLSVAPRVTRCEAPRAEQDVQDGQITATFLVEGSGSAGISARMNLTSETGYSFWIDHAGNAVGRRLANGSEGLLFSLHSPAVVVGGMNTLVLSLQGGVLSFLVNGQVIRTVRDAHPLPPGSWGICVGSSAGATQGHYSHVALVGALAPASRPTLPTGPYQAISDTDFSVGNEQNWTFGLNTTANGEIGGGRYNLSVQNGWTQVEYPLNFAPLGDGQVATIVRPEGRGKVGIMGRWTKDAQGKWDLYAFWIDNLGYIGATRWLRDQTTTLFQLHTNLVRANQDNVLVLRMTGATLLFYLNDRHVYTYHASTALPAGRWGMYISSDTGDGMTQAHYLRVLIAG